MAKKKKNKDKKQKPLPSIKKTNKGKVVGIKGVGVKKKRKYTKHKGVRYGRPIRLKGMPKSKPNGFILFKNRVYRLIKNKPYGLPYFDKRFSELMRLLWEKKKQYEKNEKVPFKDSEIIYFSEEFFGASKQVSVLLDKVKDSSPHTYYDIEGLLEELSLIEANLKIHIQEFTTKNEYIFPHEIVRDSREIYERYFQSWVAWANLVHHSYGWDTSDKIKMFVRVSDWCYDQENDYYHIEMVICDVNGNPNCFGFYPNYDEYYTLDDYKEFSGANIVITDICNCKKKLYTKANESGEEEISYEKPNFSDLKDEWEWCEGEEKESTQEKETEGQKKQEKTSEEKEIESERVKQEKEKTKESEERAKKVKAERKKAEAEKEKAEIETKQAKISELTNRILEFGKLVKMFDEIGDKENANKFREKIKEAVKKLDELT